MKDDLDLSEITLDDLIDVAILSHGFTPYKRDYFFHIETMWKDKFAGQYLVVFKHCYSLSYNTIANNEILKQSWNECFIDFEEYLKAGEPEGYVWGTNWSNAYPGFSNLKNSEKATKWTKELGKEMRELIVESEIFKINLIYHNWTIEKLNEKTDIVTQAFFPLK